MKRIKTTGTPIPSDLVFDVLTRLPAKSVIRFRCVCKHWSSLTRDPFFAELHLTRGQTRPRASCLVISYTDREYMPKQYLYFVDHKGKELPKRLSIPEFQCVTQVVNGLICLINPDRVSVCNLTTREVASLLDSSLKQRSSSSVKHNCFLFGFDPLAKEYKVLKVCTIVWQGKKNNVERKKKEYEIFTLGTKSWRKIKPRPYNFPSHCKYFKQYKLHIESVCVDGIIYWIHDPYAKGKRFIGAFDVRDEKFLPAIPFPAAAGVSRETKCPIQIKGCLVLADIHGGRFTHQLRIWILEDYKNQVWRNKIIFFPKHSTIVHNPPLPIGSIHTGEILFIKNSRCTGPLYLICYDPEREKSRKINITDLLKLSASSSYVVRFRTEYYYEELDTRNLIRFLVDDHQENIMPLRRDV